MAKIIRPSSLKGCIAAPAAKAEAHRALLCAALANQPTQIQLNNFCDDIDATGKALSALGAELRLVQPGRYLVCPFSLQKSVPTIPQIHCDDCGATLRFLLPVAAALGFSCRFTGSAGLAARPLTPLLQALEQHGARLDGQRLPLTLSASTLSGGLYLLPGNISSQYISGLLLALPLLAQDSEIVLSSPLQSASYVEITLAMLELFSIRILQTEQGYYIKGGQRYRSPGLLQIAGDWSGAAFFLTAGAIGGDVTVTGLAENSTQGDREIVPLLRLMGAKLHRAPGLIRAEQAPLQAIEVDMADIPDLLPPLAMAAAAGEGTSLFYNAARLRYKESDRLDGVCALLNALGGQARQTRDTLAVTGNPRLKGGWAESRGDHRLAMAAAIAATLSTGEIKLTADGCVRKSYPNFWQDFSTLGGSYYEL